MTSFSAEKRYFGQINLFGSNIRFWTKFEFLNGSSLVSGVLLINLFRLPTTYLVTPLVFPGFDHTFHPLAAELALVFLICRMFQNLVLL